MAVMQEMDTQEFDVAVIGAGSAGPKAARTAAKLGVKVAIFEESLIGGECLYTGCVPSKALIHSATLWSRMRNAAAFGLPDYAGKDADFGAVMRHARRTIEEVGGGDAVASFAKQGITTLCERGRVCGPVHGGKQENQNALQSQAVYSLHGIAAEHSADPWAGRRGL